MNRKKLITIAVVIIISIVLLIIALGKTSSLNNGKNNSLVQADFKSNSQKLIDYGCNVIKYGNDVYFLDDLSSSIIKYNPKSSATQKVVDLTDKNYENNFFIVSNHLIFSYDNVTYYSDLNGNSEKKFCDGRVEFINDDVYMYVQSNGQKDNLCVVSYNYKSFKTIPNTYYILAKGRNIEYLKSREKEVYFTSENMDDTISLLEVDLNNSKTTLVGKLNANTDDPIITNAFSDVIKNKDYYYYTTKKITNTYFSREESRGNLYSRSILYSVEDIIHNDVGFHLVNDPKMKNQILYEQYDDDEISSEWLSIADSTQTSYTWRDLIYGDVTHYFSLQDMSLYNNYEKVANFEIRDDYYTLAKVVCLDDGYYVCIESDNEHTWYYCSKNGKNVKKIYEGKNIVKDIYDPHKEQ